MIRSVFASNLVSRTLSTYVTSVSFRAATSVVINHAARADTVCRLFDWPNALTYCVRGTANRNEREPPAVLLFAFIIKCRTQRRRARRNDYDSFVIERFRHINWHLKLIEDFSALYETTAGSSAHMSDLNYWDEWTWN